MRENYLMHEGRKGQRWGVLNGPPYPLSHEKVVKYAEKQEKRLKSAKQTHEDVKKMRNTSNKYKKKDKFDLSNMSDEELRKKIDRLRLENNYIDQYNRRNNRGKSTVDTIFDAVGDTITYSDSAVNLAIKVAKAVGAARRKKARKKNN